MKNENQIVMKNFKVIKRLLKEQNIEVNSVDELKNMCNANWYEIVQYLPIQKYQKDFEVIGVYYNKSVNGLVYCDSGEITVGGQSNVYAINCKITLKQNSDAVVFNCEVTAMDASKVFSNKSKVLQLDNSYSNLNNSFAVLKDNSFTNATNSTVLDKSNGLSSYCNCRVKCRGNHSNVNDSVVDVYGCEVHVNNSQVYAVNSNVNAWHCVIDSKDSNLILKSGNKVKVDGGNIYEYMFCQNEIEGETNIIRMQ